ncbi:MAG: hypothetical protein LUO89_08125 [Methanothrix sp.]|nr:hypothetical protein [Methanothrix sp.]
MDEDEVLSKITKLLEKGCTMLATHHDCGAPLFRCQGVVVCPVCSFADKPDLPAGAQSQVLSGIEPDKKTNGDSLYLQKSGKMDDLSSDKGTKPSISGEQGDEELRVAIGNLRASLLHRLRELTSDLDDENDLDKLKKQLDCLEGLLKVFRSLQW